MSADLRHMREALELARGGRGRVEPNPLVGAVVVRGDEVVGRGFHARYGGPHAEVAALADADDRAAGATLYVTLEPCGHAGKTPPCADAILEAGVARVVFAAADPDPITSGLSPRRLAEAGIEVESGLLEEESRAMNARFVRALSSDLPFTIAKWAMRLDGKIADVEGGSKYITGAASRRLVHELRGAVDAVAVGVGTLLADDPDLTVREGAPVRHAARVVFDTNLRTPATARVVVSAPDTPTVILCGPDADPERESPLVAAGVRVLRTGGGADGLDLREALRLLKENGMHRVLLEGGGRIHASALRAGVVRQVMAFTAPILLGGGSAPTPVDGPGFALIGNAPRLSDVSVTQLGDDLLIEGFLD